MAAKNRRTVSPSQFLHSPHVCSEERVARESWTLPSENENGLLAQLRDLLSQHAQLQAERSDLQENQRGILAQLNNLEAEKKSLQAVEEGLRKTCAQFEKRCTNAEYARDYLVKKGAASWDPISAQEDFTPQTQLHDLKGKYNHLETQYEDVKGQLSKSQAKFRISKDSKDGTEPRYRFSSEHDMNKRLMSDLEFSSVNGVNEHLKAEVDLLHSDHQKLLKTRPEIDRKPGDKKEAGERLLQKEIEALRVELKSSQMNYEQADDVFDLVSFILLIVVVVGVVVGILNYGDELNRDVKRPRKDHRNERLLEQFVWFIISTQEEKKKRQKNFYAYQMYEAARTDAKIEEIASKTAIESRAVLTAVHRYRLQWDIEKGRL